MNTQHVLPLDGYCHGPLFSPVRKRRLSKRAERNESGGAEVWRKYKRARPPWVVPDSVQVYWDLSRLQTILTGVQHSVDHEVPLQHPLVCGLHAPANMRVIPLADNLRKSNNHWRDMWSAQAELEL